MKSLTWSGGGKGKVVCRWRNGSGGSCINIMGEVVGDQGLVGLPEYLPATHHGGWAGKAHQNLGHKGGELCVGVGAGASPLMAH